MNLNELSRIEDSDLYFAVAIILCGFEKYSFAFYALVLAIFCFICKMYAQNIKKSIK